MEKPFRSVEPCRGTVLQAEKTFPNRFEMLESFASASLSRSLEATSSLLVKPLSKPKLSLQNMKIISTQPHSTDFGLFTSLSESSYPHNAYRQLQSNSLNWAFLYKCLVVIRSNQSVGRVALYLNPHIKYKNADVLLVGNYECEDDAQTAMFLHQSIENECKNLNINHIIGPINGSTWDDYRFRTSGDSHPYFLESYHHLYYNQQFTTHQFEPLADYFSFIEYLDNEENRRHLQRESYYNQNGIQIRNIDLNRYDEELEKLFRFSSEVFSQNFLYSPISLDIFRAKYQKIKPFIEPEYVYIAENSANEVVAFLFTVPDVLNPQNIVGKTVAARSGRLYAGLGGLLAAKLSLNARQKGFRSIIHAYIISHSKSANFSASKGEVYSRYRLYIKNVD